VPRYEDQERYRFCKVTGIHESECLCAGCAPKHQFSATGHKGRYGLPTGREERKAIPMATGLLDYFPLALASVAMLSKVGNDQHNPGQPLHWSREKSNDHADTALRHLTERGSRDTDKVRHMTKAAWRALAALQIEIENDGGAL
jgi:hypothetical protein